MQDVCMHPTVFILPFSDQEQGVCVWGGQKSANSIRDPAVRAVCEVGISALSFFGANICSGLSVSLVFPL